MRLNYRISIFRLIPVIVLALFVTACSTTRTVPKGEYLLKSNNVEVKSRNEFLRLKSDIENKSNLESDLLQYARQKPNRKTLGLVKFNLMVYNRFRGTDSTGFKHWIRENIGEPPVVFDTTLMHASVTQMQGYLFNKGFLKNNVEASFKTRGRKAAVTYTAYPGDQYRIGEIIFPEPTDPVPTLIVAYSYASLLRTGDPLDLDVLDNESKRIAADMANNGYYRFDPGLIKYDADTSTGLNVRLYMRLVEDTATLFKRIFYLRDFKVYTDYNPQREARIPSRDSIGAFVYYYDTLLVRPYVVQNAMVLASGQKYSRENYDLTLQRLSDLGIFKFISIRFVPTGPDSLDCVVRLTPDERSVVRAELEGNNVETNVGTGVKFSVRNRNWLKRANKFEYNISGGTEIPLFGSGYPLVEGNMQLGFSFPRIFPHIPASVIPRRKPQNLRITRTTRINTSLNYQRRSGLYRIGSYTTSFGWEWRKAPRVTFQYNPIAVTTLESQPLSDAFRDQLIRSEQLRLSFQDQIITGSNATFVYTDPSENRNQSYNYFRAYGETAGFTIWPFQNKSNPPANGLNYTILDSILLPYANFVKFETDLRRYFVADPNRMLATRVFAGAGFHFWNSNLAMPYIKQYYAGGSSDIRAWRVRHLGPGSFAYPDSTVFVNQTGDIKLEGNVEYRFGIFGLLKGALFVDAGNVWTLKPNALQPDGDFKLNRFYKEVAIGSGLGFRLDFGFFIFRLDMAVPIRDPGVKQIDDIWLFNSTSWPFERSNDYNGWKKFRQESLTLNLAIGYPF